MQQSLNNLLKIAIQATQQATDEILKVYNSNAFSVTIKEDKSPLTLADKNAHNVIKQTLLQTNIPIISEEDEIPNYNKRNQWPYFWLVDPLDGTKEFIKKNGDFTVNIALIKNEKPVLGVVSIPTEKTIYWAIKDQGAFKQKVNEAICKINISPRRNPVRITISRSHLNTETTQFLSKYSSPVLIPTGSSKKILLVAEGLADIYPRLGPTMEWDIAAAHIIALEAGASMRSIDNKNIRYNKKDLHNPFFIVQN